MRSSPPRPSCSTAGCPFSTTEAEGIPRMAASLLPLTRRRPTLRVHPAYREFLEQRGLNTPADFLALTGVIVCGHPDRHVLRVTLGTGPETITCFLKREHRVPWLARLANAWAGFGPVSQSCREA